MAVHLKTILQLISSKSIFFSAILIAITSTAFCQKATRVKRKGLLPVTVVKLNPGGRLSYSMQQLSGKWQEILRTDRNNDTLVSFKDSLCLTFSEDNVRTRDGVKMSMEGKALLQRGNYLIAAADVFIVKSLNKNAVVLDDGEKCIHTLLKKENFWFENAHDSSFVPQKNLLPVPITLPTITGKWQIYRRDALPGSLSSYDYLLRSLNVIFIRDKNNASGEISFYLGEKLQTDTCSITLEGEEIFITTNTHVWVMNTYKANNNEFIFGDIQLTYYSKPF